MTGRRSTIQLSSNRRMMRSLCGCLYLWIYPACRQGYRFGRPCPCNVGNLDFRLDVSGNNDGLSLLISGSRTHTDLQGSFRVMRVFYDNNVCGPLLTALGTLSKMGIPWAWNDDARARQFTLLMSSTRLSVIYGDTRSAIRVQLVAMICKVYYLSADGHY